MQFRPSQSVNREGDITNHAVLSAQAQRDHDSEEQVYANWYANHSRFSHVLTNPNALRGRKDFEAVVEQTVRGKRVLEIGCSTGRNTKLIAQYDASYVIGTDISTRKIATAQETHTIPGRCEFALLDATLPFDGQFDVIVGQAVLHHFPLVYQDVLLRLQRENLSTDGCMLFYEPLISNLWMRLFRHFSKNAHTQDERPFSRKDILWMRQHFSGFKLLPVNYVSIPLGVLSSFLFKSPDNALLRFADRVDCLLAKHVHFLHTRFRYATFILQ